NRNLAIVGIGDRTDERTESKGECETLEALAQMCAVALENARAGQALSLLNRKLSLKVFQLNTLFELSKDFYSVWDAQTIFHILGSTLIGQLVLSRCAVLIENGTEFEAPFTRGFTDYAPIARVLNEPEVRTLLSVRNDPVTADQTGQSSLRALFSQRVVHAIVPMSFNGKFRGVVLLGEKANSQSWTREDYDFAVTLSNLALAAKENAPRQHGMTEKKRGEKKLSMPREIKMSFFPVFTPAVAGYEFASAFPPCYQVGGDYFDFLPASEGRMAITIGDFSGKS